MASIMLDYHSRSGTMPLNICHEGVHPATDYFVRDYCTRVPKVLANLSSFGTRGGTKVQYALSWRRGETEYGQHRHRLLSSNPASVVKSSHYLLGFTDR
tara:strand:+ start:202 stop:498 length:297 start_codon:yes stop_codon:yes gene_type:complete